jgi:hypothetical protein
MFNLYTGLQPTNLSGNYQQYNQFRDNIKRISPSVMIHKFMYFIIINLQSTNK